MHLSPTSPAWLTAWNNSPDREIFAHPAYAALFENEKTSAGALLWQGPHGRVLYPFLLRELRGEPFWRPEDGGLFDMVSPYGYGGPKVISGEPSQELYSAFYYDLQHWAAKQKVVSEFVRFSLFDNARLAYHGEAVHHNDNIVVDLGMSTKDLWKGFHHKVRKNVRSAQTAGLKIIEDPAGERLGEFLEVYYHTLERRGAAKDYFWPQDFLQKMLANLTQQLIFFHALHKEKVVASELVLLSATRIYSYLGGTFNEYFYLRPGDLLKYHIMLWAQERGFRQFVIGGGHKPHDGIFAFKQAFAPAGIYPFFVGKKILDREVYERLTERVGRCGVFFPEYRTRR